MVASQTELGNLGLWESAEQSLGVILEESPGSLGRVPGNAWGA